MGSMKNLSTVAGSNTSAAPNGAPEGMTMASCNDTMREMMATMRTLAAPTTLAAATTTDIGSKDETIITLTGVAVTITGLGTVSAGIYKFVIYNAAHILTHNATSLILIGGANRTVAAGDSSLFVSEGSGNWRELTFGDVSETLTSYLPKAGGTMTGLFTQAAGADIASAATVDLSTATGNSPRITGTVATSAVTMNAGQWALVVANAAWPLTYNATTNKLNGGVSYTCVAGDMVLYNKDLSGIVHGFIIKADGTAVVTSAVVAHGQAYRSTAFDISAITTWTDVPLTGGNNNLVNTAHDTGTNPARFTVSVTGVYQINYHTQIRRQGSAHHTGLRLFKNATSEIPGSFVQGILASADANEVHNMVGSVLVSLAANDYVTIQASTNIDVTNEIDYFDDASVADPTTFITAAIVVAKVG